jgi:CRISPR-associated endonuclease Cas1
MDVQESTHASGDLAESATSFTFNRDAENPAVCVVDGYGVQISTRAGRLVVSDGIGRQRRQRVYNRATHGLSRLVLMATTGHVTLEAHRWLDQLGIGLVMLDPSTGEVTMASTRVANDDARLRRAQALAPGTTTGLDVARYLIRIKLAGQAAIAQQDLDAPGVAASILKLTAMVDQSSTLEEIRQLEASAASLYWSAWERVEATFVKADAARVPDNWRAFEGRRSAVNPGTARNATDPINAMVNYCSRLIEAEGHIATVAVGLDPGLGVVHADTRGRASFVLDLIEVARPLAERHILRLIRTQPLRWRDFHEDARGAVRVLPPLTHRLAEAMPGFASTLAPVVEHIAQLLGSASPYDVATPSTLTREKHKAAARRRIDSRMGEVLPPLAPAGPGIEGLGPRRKRRQKPTAELEPALPLPICKGCGLPLSRESDRPRRRGAYCPECLATRRKEVGMDLSKESVTHMSDFEERTGVRPSHTAAATARRKAANQRQQWDQATWEQDHQGEDHDADWFRSEILPGLVSVTLSRIAEATGMSVSTASKIRAGRRIPHPRHWTVLAQIVKPE